MPPSGVSRAATPRGDDPRHSPRLSAGRVVVCGDVINDVLVEPCAEVVRGSDTVSVITARPGGSAANQAAWLGHLGADVVFAGRCGARDVGYHRRELERFGVRAVLAADPDVETGSIVIMVSPDGERTMYTDRGANLRLRRADVPAGLLDGAAVLHVTGYLFFAAPLVPVALSLIADARSRGMAVTVDPGSAAFLAGLAPGEFVDWTAGAAVCFPNLDEAAVLTGLDARDPAAMAAALTKYYGAVVLKLGGAGCVLAAPDSDPVQFVAHPADVRDTTGAGDAFCAAFLSKWLSAPTTSAPASSAPALSVAALSATALSATAQFAIAVAATAVTHLGGRPPIPR